MDVQIGKIISVYRKRAGLTQEQLGETVGVSGQAVSKWEGGGVPDTLLLPNIASALGVSIDALFGIENNISNMMENEIEKLVFDFCHSKRKTMNYFEFLFNLLWSAQCGHLGNDEFIELDRVIDKYDGDPQVTSQVINNNGTAYLSLVKAFPFFCAVKDTDEIAERLVSEPEFGGLFSLLADEDSRKAVFFTQSETEPNQYTVQGLAEAIGIDCDKLKNVLPLLVKYDLIAETCLALDGNKITVYHKLSNPEIRPIFMMAYQFIHARRCYYNFVSHRTKRYF